MNSFELGLEKLHIYASIPLAVICLFKLFVSSRFNFCNCVHIEIYLFCILIFLIHTGRETERDGVREVGGQTACGSWFSLSIR